MASLGQQGQALDNAEEEAVNRIANAWQSSDKQYKPQAYPQISQDLMQISRAIAGTDVNAAIRQGYALVTDVNLALGIVARELRDLGGSNLR